jgi:hypothetical protein
MYELGSKLLNRTSGLRGDHSFHPGPLFRGRDESLHSKRYHSKNLFYNCRRVLLRGCLPVNYLQRLLSSTFVVGLTVQQIAQVKMYAM